MNNKEIEINYLLAEWDPLGVKQIAEFWPNEEYKDYVSIIINKYHCGISIYDYLIQLFSDLHDFPTNSEIMEIVELEKKMLEILNNKNI